jgi:hypothetical protein
VLRPKLVDQAVGRDNSICLKEEEGEYRALLRPPKRQPLLPRPHLERAEDPVVKLRHASPSPQPDERSTAMYPNLAAV